MDIHLREMKFHRSLQPGFHDTQRSVIVETWAGRVFRNKSQNNPMANTITGWNILEKVTEQFCGYSKMLSGGFRKIPRDKPMAFKREDGPALQISEPLHEVHGFKRQFFPLKIWNPSVTDAVGDVCRSVSSECLTLDPEIRMNG